MAWIRESKKVPVIYRLLFWGGMVCNILVFLMLLYGMLGK